MCVTLFYYESNNKMLHPLPTKCQHSDVQAKRQSAPKKAIENSAQIFTLFLTRRDQQDEWLPAAQVEVQDVPMVGRPVAHRLCVWARRYAPQRPTWVCLIFVLHLF
jgi:hypothetical protein